MFMRNPPRVTVVLALALVSSAAVAQGPNLGKPVSPAEIAAWDISVLPDGSGLPPGSGTSAQGALIYTEKCVACHGEEGKGGRNIALVGAHGEPPEQEPEVVGGKSAPRGRCSRGMLFAHFF